MGQATMPVTGTNDAWERMRFGWMDHHSTKGEVVEVWAGNGVRRAIWDGESWIDEATRAVLVGVTHWRPVRV